MFGYILKTLTVCNQRDIVQIGTNKLNKQKPNSTIYICSRVKLLIQIKFNAIISRRGMHRRFHPKPRSAN